MRIAMIGVRHAVDDDRIYHKEASSLRKRGHEVVIIARPRVSPHNPPRGIKFIEVRGNVLMRIIKSIVKGLQERADVYHVHDMESLISGIVIKLLRPGSHLIWDVHEYYPDMIPLSNLMGKIFLSFMCYIVEPIVSKLFISSIITADEATAQRYINWSDNVIVVHNYVEFPSLRSNEKINNNVENNLVKRLTVLPKPVIVYVGGISKDRGTEFLGEIATAVNQINGSVVLVGPIKDESAKILSQHERILYLGHVPHEMVPLIIRKCHIGIIPLQEIPKYMKNIPIKLFEYLHSGLPIISSKLSATCKYIESGNCGLCVHYGDVDGVLNAIRNIVENYLTYKRNSLKLSHLYSWKLEEKKLFKLYNRLMEGRNHEMDGRTC